MGISAEVVLNEKSRSHVLRRKWALSTPSHEVCIWLGLGLGLVRVRVGVRVRVRAGVHHDEVQEAQAEQEE